MQYVVWLVSVALAGALGWALARGRVAPDRQAVEALQAMSARTMAQASEQLVALAEQRYARLESTAEARWQHHGEAVRQRLTELGTTVERVERERVADSSTLRRSVEELASVAEATRTEARSLAGALRGSSIRGRWGEVQLRRCLEAAGLRPGVDFVEQSGAWSGEGTGRPDVVVHLPDGVHVVIDSKVPLDRYLDACATDDRQLEQRLLREHAKAVHDHVLALARRDYAELVGGPVELVAMFLPKEHLLDLAIEHRPAILEVVRQHRIVLVTPSTVNGLLHTVAALWKEHRVAEAAEDIRAAGEELYQRLSLFLDHFTRTGRALSASVKAYNDAVGSLDARLLPSARRMASLGIGGSRDLPVVDLVDETARSPRTELDERQLAEQRKATSTGATTPSVVVSSTATVPPLPPSSTSMPVSESSGDW